ncbi:MAG TPA: glycosyltransferase family 39 protein [Candidatus Aquicultor sp.]|jgi:hypothetical protein
MTKKADNLKRDTQSKDSSSKRKAQPQHSASKYSDQVVHKPVQRRNPKANELTTHVAAILQNETFILVGILVVALIFRLYRLHEPFGGFHGFNEAFYANLARDYLNKPIFELFTKPVDLNNPPLFTFMLVLMYKLIGVSEAVSRIIPIAASMGAIFYSYLLASRLFSRTTGLVTAALLSVSPAFSILSRNVQADMVFVCFILAAFYHYERGRDSQGLGHTVAAGILFGLALLAKLPAVLGIVALVIYEIFRSKGAVLKSRSFIGVMGLTALVAALWYGYQLLFNAGAFLSSQESIAGVLQLPDSRFWYELFLKELVWAFNPLMFVLAIIGIVYLGVKRSVSGSMLILSIILGFTSFYILYHFHTYYLLPLMPFGIIAAAYFLESLFQDRKQLVIATVGLYMVSVFFTGILMHSVKFGYTEFADIKNLTGQPISESTTVYAQQIVFDNFGTLLSFYFPNNRIIPLPNEALTKKSDSIAVTFGRFKGQEDARLNQIGVYPIAKHDYYVVLLGKGFREEPGNMHRFAFGNITAIDTGSSLDFGIKDVPRIFGFNLLDMRQQQAWMDEAAKAGLAGLGVVK